MTKNFSTPFFTRLFNGDETPLKYILELYYKRFRFRDPFIRLYVPCSDSLLSFSKSIEISRHD